MITRWVNALVDKFIDRVIDRFVDQPLTGPLLQQLINMPLDLLGVLPLNLGESDDQQGV